MLKKRSQSADLTFRELKIYYAEKGHHLADQSFETNLNLRNADGEYNLLAELLADRNNTPFLFVKFQGMDKSAISERNDYGYGCLLTTYMKVKDRLKAENICISDTSVRPRYDRYLFDFDCVNEAVLNALVHNDWTITEPQISMFSNRLEILSHGGLPGGLTTKAFFEGISRPRNATLMRIFLSLGLTEHTGHGIPTIVKQYGQDVFDINENYIKCTIPFDQEVLERQKKNVGLPVSASGVLNKTEQQILKYVLVQPDITAGELAAKINVTTRTVERNIASLQKKGKLVRNGSKRDGKWKVIG